MVLKKLQSRQAFYQSYWKPGMWNRCNRQRMGPTEALHIPSLQGGEFLWAVEEDFQPEEAPLPKRPPYSEHQSSYVCCHSLYGTTVLYHQEDSGRLASQSVPGICWSTSEDLCKWALSGGFWPCPSSCTMVFFYSTVTSFRSSEDLSLLTNGTPKCCWLMKFTKTFIQWCNKWNETLFLNWTFLICY